VSVTHNIDALQKLSVCTALREVLAGGSAASFVFSDSLPTAVVCFAISTVIDVFCYRRHVSNQPN